MRRAAALAAFVVLGAASTAAACTTFLFKRGGIPIVGKSYDWDIGDGLVLHNKRGVRKAALPLRPGETTARWISRHASLTFNQYGRELPNGGMNDAGLVVEIMWLKSSRAPATDARPAINELQWIQYQLDRFETVAEVVAHAPELRMAPLYAKVHYLACDRTGDCASVEYLDGKLVVHHGDALPHDTLTNNTYAESLRFLKTHQGFGGTRKVPGGKGSRQRFARATARARDAANAEGDPVAAAFGILDGVSLGDYSKWNIVYEPQALRVHFRSRGHTAIKTVELKRFDSACGAPVKMLELNTDLGGDVTGQFSEITTAANRDLIRRSFAPIKAQLPPGVLEAVSGLPASFTCQEK